VNDIHSEIRRIISALRLEEGPRRLLFAAVSEKGKSPYAALELLWLVEDLRAEAAKALALFQRKELLQNLLELVRNGHKDWVGRVCHLLYVGSHAPEKSGGLLPAEMIRDLLQWVNGEQREKEREILWAVLLQKGIGLESVAKVSDVAPALCEADPITRNNAVRFLFEHFKPGEV
jgi:HEAT repeat protein